MATKFQVGDRFEDKDYRSEGRIIEIVDVEISELDGLVYYTAVVEANPKNLTAVGHHTTLSAATLSRRYRKISH